MNQIILIIANKTIAKTQQDRDIFLKNFQQLYRLEILVTPLNLIATQAQKGNVDFVIQPLKTWDRCAGHCETKGFFSRVGGLFSKNLSHEIVIKTNESYVIMHEIAHAIEKISGIDLNGDFRKVIGLDMRNNSSSYHEVANAVQNVMVDELKNYKLNNVMEELFARYFEMISMSYEAGGFSKYKFKYSEIAEYFYNTTHWVESYFNPLVGKLIDKNIASASKELVSELGEYQKSWVNETRTQSYTTDSGGKKNWASGTKSTARWSNAWNELENKDTNKILIDKDK